MINLEEVLTTLRVDSLRLAQLDRERVDLGSLQINAAMKDERDKDLKDSIERQRKLSMNVLRNMVEFPPQHTRHGQLLNDFHLVAPYEKSVFVMTKFPDKAKPAALNAELEAVIQAVRDAVKARGYEARLAKDVEYHNSLWDNVELYLLGCSRGIAIVEDKYVPELNPNVSMEWGWMRGMGRNVLYLVEKDFKNQRADWGGLIEKEFDWANPVADITAHVNDWLK